MSHTLTTATRHAEQLAQTLSKQNAMLVLAESCTGGLIAQICTSLAGSSAWFDRGFVTYSNAAKVAMIGVDVRLIDTHGAVSGEVAQAMAVGALANANADFAISVSGIAGPSGGRADKPVGTVYFGFARLLKAINDADTSISAHQIFTGDRTAVREQSAAFALKYLIDWI